MISSSRRWLLVFAVLFLGGSLFGAVPTAISTVPYTITKPGRYALSKSLVYPGSGMAITINSDDVLLDLGDWTLESLSPGTGPQVSVTTQTAGIYALNRHNITIRNGTIRGFFRGIYLEGTGGRDHLVEKIHANACTFLGIQVKGTGSIVRENRVSKVGGTTNYTTERVGIDVQGDCMVVAENVVNEVRPNSLGGTDRAYGIRVLNSSSVQINRNSVGNPEGTQSFSLTATAGIEVAGCSFTQIAGNQISGFSLGVEISNGSSNYYRDNTATRVVTGYSITGSGAAYAAGPANFP